MQKHISLAFRACLVVIALVFAVVCPSPSLLAQTATTGSINGLVTDPTGAAVPNATITVKDTLTGATINLVSNAEGRFTAPFLKPDPYELKASAPGLNSSSAKVQVLTGQQSALNIVVSPSASTQSIEVVANNAQLIDTQSSNTTTTFTTQQFEQLPAPGGDITTIAYTVPGVVMGAGTQGFGSIVSDGLPGLSNVVTINGIDYNVSLYGGLNFSGSSNLTLGQQEIAEAAVVQNGYSVQYGRQAGIIETYVTKGGSNRIHGLAQWQYNSDGLNANDFFNNQSGIPRPKAVSNQYAAQIGGPILKNKLFFFADTEGIRYIQPSTGFVNLPSPALQASVLANPNINADSKALYKAMFAGTNASPAYKNAIPVVTGGGAQQDASGSYGCGGLAGTPDYATGGTLGTSSAESCIDSAFVNVGALNREWLVAGRVDWNISDKHKIFFRVTDDQGNQPSFVSLINSSWDQVSSQPSYTGQLNDTYMFSPNVANQFIAGALYSSGIFKPANLQAGLASSPTEFDEPVDGGTNSTAGVGQPTFFTASTTLGSPWVDFPGGTNSAQYQVMDDVSWTKGDHAFKFGFDFLRYDMSDVSLLTNAYGGDFAFGGGIADEFGGTLQSADSFSQGFPAFGNIHSAVYNLGIFAQDEWHVKPNLVFDLGLRIDRNGNPLCNDNCYTRYVGGFPNTAATLDTPYNATISAGHGSFVPQMEAAVVQPRFGFNLDLRGDGKTVIRGGVGLFSDNFPGLILEQTYLSFPNRYFAGITTGNIGTGPGSAKAIATASAAAVLGGFSQGQTFNQISASLAAQGGSFSPPNYVTTPHEFHSPRYMEYSLQLERRITNADAVILSYAGNHGFDLYITNNHLNQNIGSLAAPGVFNNLPAASPDPRFAAVTTFSNNAISNYNGFSVQYKHVQRGGLTADLSYTYSHSLDDISNGGNPQLPYNGNTTISSQITPGLPSALMYSNSDYDIRHNFLLDLVYAEPYKFTNRIVNSVGGGWTFSAKSYWRSGEPFSVVNSTTSGAIFNGTGGTTVLADVLTNQFNHHCNSYSSPCLQQSGIFNGGVQTNFGNVPRNSFYGPHYADVDTALYKNLYKRESVAFQIGAQAYNTFNHVNFGPPANNASNPTTLGHISTDVNAPTSPYGSSQEPTVSGRVLVVEGKLVF